MKKLNIYINKMSFVSSGYLDDLFATIQTMTSDSYEDYSDHTIDMVTSSVKLWCNVDADSTLIRVVAKLWMESKNGIIPSLDDLILFYEFRVCFCMETLEQSIRRNLLKHFLVNFGRVPRCPEINAAISYYYLSSHQFPTQEQLRTILVRTMELLDDPDNFYLKDKVHIPVSNLDKIKSCISSDNSECHICLENITKGQEIFKLNCNHCFHANKADCLDECNIIDWLSINKYCPVCRVEVKL